MRGGALSDALRADVHAAERRALPHRARVVCGPVYLHTPLAAPAAARRRAAATRPPIIHRDVKSANVLDAATPPRARLSDGLARDLARGGGR